MEPLFEISVSDVLNWGKERGIHSSDLRPQFIKLVEELGELAEGIIKKDQWKIEDAVGDMLVVLTNFGACVATLLYPSDIEAQEKYAQNFLGHCLHEAWLVIKVRKGWTNEGVFIKEERIIP